MNSTQIISVPKYCFS